jgi:hypothetical protein
MASMAMIPSLVLGAGRSSVLAWAAPQEIPAKLAVIVARSRFTDSVVFTQLKPQTCQCRSLSQVGITRLIKVGKSNQ